MAPHRTAAADSAKPSLKILMLHGYTQSGPNFHAKTRALEKYLKKAFPAHSVSLSYPTGPMKLLPSDIPGYTPSAESEGQEEDPEAYGWWRRSSVTDPPEYVGLDKGLEVVANVLREEGPFDGVIGFSQGAAFAAMVSALLEPDRRRAFEYFADPTNAAIPGEDSKGVSGIEFPPSFEGIDHPPMKFSVWYSGFRSPGPRYRAFYEHPAVQTPVLHVIGTLDSVVEETRSRVLMQTCAGDPEKEGRVVIHPGGHFLPCQKPYMDAAALFIRGCIEKDKNGGEEEERVEDMDLPF